MATSRTCILLRRQFLTHSRSIRFFHKAGPLCQGYKINYEQLRSGRQIDNLPKTLKDNVKSVVGWRGGAERGFLATYPDCIHVLAKEGTKENPDLEKWYRKVLTYNLSQSVLKQRYGILVPITYKQLRPTATKDEMKMAHILGWCVEMIRAAAIVTTDTVALQSQVRYGHRRDRETQLWSKKHNLGNKAFNDALLIERGVFVLLKHFFGDEATIYYEPITRAQRSRALGRALGYSLLTGNTDGQPRLNNFNLKNYKALTRSHVSQTNYCLPISLALHLAGLHGEKLHELAHSILHEMGYYVEVNRDFNGCFLDPKGTDIADGRLTCLITLALQRATRDQKKLLDENYGYNEQEKVEVVKQIYKELKLKKSLATHIEEQKDGILSRIQGISWKDGLTPIFFFKLLELMDMNDIS